MLQFNEESYKKFLKGHSRKGSPRLQTMYKVQLKEQKISDEEFKAIETLLINRGVIENPEPADEKVEQSKESPFDFSEDQQTIYDSILEAGKGCTVDTINDQFEEDVLAIIESIEECNAISIDATSGEITVIPVHTEKPKKERKKRKKSEATILREFVKFCKSVQPGTEDGIVEMHNLEAAYSGEDFDVLYNKVVESGKILVDEETGAISFKGRGRKGSGERAGGVASEITVEIPEGFEKGVHVKFSVSKNNKVFDGEVEGAIKSFYQFDNIKESKLFAIIGVQHEDKTYNLRKRVSDLTII